MMYKISVFRDQLAAMGMREGEPVACEYVDGFWTAYGECERLDGQEFFCTMSKVEVQR